MTHYTQIEELSCEAKIRKIGWFLIGLILISAAVSFAWINPLAINGKPLATFENIAFDRSGNGNNGTIYGGAVLGQGELEFDGIDDYVDAIEGWQNPMTFLLWAEKITKDNRIIIATPSTGYNYLNSDYYGNFRISSYGTMINVPNNPITNEYCCMAGTTSETAINSNLYIRARNIVTGAEISTNHIGGKWYPHQFIPVTLAKDSADKCANEKIRDFRKYNRELTDSEWGIYKSYCDAGLTMPFDAISTNGLVAFYDFERDTRPLSIIDETWFFEDLLMWQPYVTNNADDYSGKEKDGTIDTPTYAGLDSGYLFDGVDDMITVSYPETLSENFSVTCWIRTSSSAAQVIMDKNNVEATEGRDFGLRLSAGKLVIVDNDTSSESIATMDLDTWYFISLTVSGNSIRGYIDCSLEKAIIGTFTAGTDAEVLYIGRLISGKSLLAFEGNIDDIRIYDRSLTVAELSEIFDGTEEAHPGGNER